ncbi:DUF2840 domain-containing protein [Xanthomonas translucens]|uniref:DUF2840 domain-containing protein n=1 Tax=Xanthomonas campestris pv. translucens TaxID=343 RepID=UPI0009C16728|nr:DUF2840 domain-containing protein [Xanthomonas translucens]
MVAEVVEAFAKGRANRRILTGRPRHIGPWVIGEDGTRRRLVRFAPGDRFALDLWEQNDYGTTRWRVVLCEALPSNVAGDSVPSVRPDVAILADIMGATRVRAYVAWLALNRSKIETLNRLELARIEQFFQRMPLARLKVLTADVRAKLPRKRRG